MPALTETDSIAALQSMGPKVADAFVELEKRGLNSGSRDRVEGLSLLDQLGLLATEDLAPGVDRAEIVAGVVRELVNPAAIAQRAWKTCAAATVQIWLAVREPAEYVRLVRGLASPAGAVTFQQGDVLRRCSGTRTDDGSGRTHSSRLLQAAFMDFANESHRYCNFRDRSFPRRGRRYSGIFPEQFDRLLEAATGQEWETLEVAESNARQALDAIEDALLAGLLVPVTLGGGRRRHKILVDRNAVGAIEAIDPVGKRVKFEKSEFRKRLHCVSLPSPARLDMSEEEDKDGVPSVRLRTLAPAVPACCPGCGRPAGVRKTLSHAFGEVHVTACASCDNRAFLQAAAGLGAAFATFLAGLFIAFQFFPEEPEYASMVGAMAGAGLATWIILRTKPVVEILVSQEQPPRIEIAARDRRWLSQLARLNPGSTRSYLEKW